MRYSRQTPDGEVFDFVCLSDNLPATAQKLLDGLEDDLIKPDIWDHLNDSEDEETTAKRLKTAMLARLSFLENLNISLTKSYADENVLRHNINWIATENLR